MKKRSSKRRSGRAGQRSQRLRKRLRELYPADGVAGAGPDADRDAWGDALLEEVEGSRRPPGRAARPRRGAGADTGGRRAAGVEAVVVAIESGACTVDRDGELIECRLPSRLARDQQARIAVGDRVRLRAGENGSTWVAAVLPRRTVLSRPDPSNPRRARVIAANVDVVVHVASVCRPPLRPALIDRYLIAIDRSGAAPLICVNKIDLLDDCAAEDGEDPLAALTPYRALGIAILLCSARSGAGIEALRAAIAGKTAVFVGHSGVGKSSLLNALAEDRRQDPEAATGQVSARSGRGRHTTTGSSLYRLGDGIRVIDTPGIRELGLWPMADAELERAFPDLAALAAGCRFTDCSHLHEPGCAVRAAVADGRLDQRRLDTYQRIRASLEPPDRG